MSGIRRITLNNNPLVNDEGAEAFAEALKEDLWLKGTSGFRSAPEARSIQDRLDVILVQEVYHACSVSVMHDGTEH